ncbi:uncharacterized protein LOC62_01G001536 [Vanrija pseudolonga]|uniref:Uncharacterized protein n=1 Tax=Vanrija pseudolonga TaxID=143232 RepID=A0AAF1BJ63_9TREE|nr:hypothetical protein LOC62_01G001536 [Vanrija pseudolonga]
MSALLDAPGGAEPARDDESTHNDTSSISSAEVEPELLPQQRASHWPVPASLRPLSPLQLAATMPPSHPVYEYVVPILLGTVGAHWLWENVRIALCDLRHPPMGFRCAGPREARAYPCSPSAWPALLPIAFKAAVFAWSLAGAAVTSAWAWVLYGFWIIPSPVYGTLIALAAMHKAKFKPSKTSSKLLAALLIASCVFLTSLLRVELARFYARLLRGCVDLGASFVSLESYADATIALVEGGLRVCKVVSGDTCSVVGGWLDTVGLIEVWRVAAIVKTKVYDVVVAAQNSSVPVPATVTQTVDVTVTTCTLAPTCAASLAFLASCADALAAAASAAAARPTATATAIAA